ncbi:MAG: oligosaccharide flippase family protein [Tissierellia bacterium]|jgi:O-antigen/teichoic acid export membrane protein|nr:oligosaccharide flippase family protein [Tissierellia bacterium]
MGKGKVIISGVAWTVVNNIVSILYGIISVPFLINYFGKEQYGLIGIALSVNVYVHLLDMGMTNSNVRFFSEFIAKKEKDNIQKLFNLTHLFYLILGLLNSIILFGLSFYVQDLFKVTPDQALILRNLLWILAINATFSWLSTCFDQFIRANELIDWIKKRSTILKLMQFVVLLATIIFKQTIEFYFFGYVFLATIILPLTVLKTKRITPYLKINFGYDKKVFRTVFPYALSIFSFSIFQFIAFNSRPLILGNISGPGSVAEFSIMNTVASVVTVISGSFMQVLLPIVTKMAVKADHKNIISIVQNGTKYVNIILSLLIFLLIVCLNEIITLYVGEEYLSLVPWLIIWLLTLLLSHRNVMTSLVFTEKRLKSIAYMGAIAMLLAIIAYMVFVPIYGVGGVVIGFAIHEIIHSLFYYAYFIPQKFKINTKRIFLRQVLPVWLLFGGVSGILLSIQINVKTSILSIFILKVSLTMIVMLILIWLVLLNYKDKQVLFSIIHNK